MSTDVTFLRRSRASSNATRIKRANFALVIGQRIDRFAAVRAASPLARLPEVDAAGQLAHDDEVDALDAPRRFNADASASSASTRTGRRLANRPSPLRNASSACSGRTVALRVVPLGAADGAEQHRIGSLRLVENTRSDRHAVASIDAAADCLLGELPARSRYAATARSASTAWRSPPGPMPSPGRTRMFGFMIADWATGYRIPVPASAREFTASLR